MEVDKTLLAGKLEHLLALNGIGAAEPLFPDRGRRSGAAAVGVGVAVGRGRRRTRSLTRPRRHPPASSESRSLLVLVHMRLAPFKTSIAGCVSAGLSPRGTGPQRPHIATGVMRELFLAGGAISPRRLAARPRLTQSLARL